ncbi:glycoside hydrolase family 92 protein [Bacteroides salyersiae]|nr:glycoside hydrolase family 92 protein [Bacteroides salyersiae]
MSRDIIISTFIIGRRRHIKPKNWLRKHSRINYNADPAYGINGNDDLGQMSAWYLFTCMGFYPVSPASGEYAIGAPQFPEFSICMGGTGRRFCVSKQRIYPKKTSM